MSDLDEFKATYFDECSELLLELEEQFSAIQEGDRDGDRLNAVFRAIHSIKGGGGAFGFDALVKFAHSFETLLDYVRDGRVELSEDVVVLCIRSIDIVADFVTAAREGETLAADYGAVEKAQFDALARGEAGGGAAPVVEDEPMDEFDIDFTPVAVNFDADKPMASVAPSADGASVWTIKFTPFSTLYERANDPLLLFRELGLLGEMSVEPNLAPIPALSAFEPFGVYCSWTISLVSDKASEETIREVFEFVDGDCEIVIEKGGAAPVTIEEDLPSFAALAEEAKSERKFVPSGEPDDIVVPETETETARDEPAPAFAPNVVPMAAKPAEPAEEAGSGRPVGMSSIRVDLDKVDRVVNMVGELVITQSMLTQQMDDAIRDRYQELVRGIEVLAQTTRGLQDAVMAIRAQPVKSVFSRMPRLVRELASKTGKKIKLETIGENTEIDKTVIEQLSDPLTHMVRNSADHGIESPDKRMANGKPEIGTVRLSAEQAGGNILIIVEDDGAGINRERVLEIARERGVVGPDQQLTDEQIDNLIFAPGFSTASEVSDISGRGVGMDVVLSNIKKIGGSVHVRSWTGKGTRMTLRLPLTLAVLDVMLVKVGGSPYVIPLSSIVETIQNSRADFGQMPSGGKVLQVRGEYVQVVDLAQRFQMVSQQDAADGFVVLCEAEGNSKIALVVDDIIGQQQVVIKSLEENFERIDGIAGGTILGDGNVALIVDVQSLKSGNAHQNAA
ncbi:chemotaxis protein CheA [Pelagibacterium halotolerans]|uniref:Chemotaxis protein CheA n=1 Tax=Pelagibacterium halotolerans (strain DSM 22347 / JCM 15775 / CGMCC 1.7692 / B2) TaxID=1082931 RepID=G4RGB8_PELHB|nr:chemotaxis protein CheA [Pelagibacterium halotolerans]AEQ53094.1 signal transduction histidine kinase CheA [Pelagibacterium halotolerans B2]QJR17261.1 chemotaxis protein CheA [Pelagibacterium halotolerans]SEA87690.1 two-component system, chemotaxis family, sensor kinase CheA [Pelagibacterium halotolerans]